MATVYKILGQSAPSATTNTTIYTVPGATTSLCSTLAVCNRGSSATYRVAVIPSGDTIDVDNYIVYDSAISANDSIFLTIGITINAGDFIVVYSNSASLTFSLFGTEIT